MEKTFHNSNIIETYIIDGLVLNMYHMRHCEAEQPVSRLVFIEEGLFI